MTTNTKRKYKTKAPSR